MRYRTFGKTGLRVSVIGVGTWQFGGEWGKDFSQAEADAILDAAADCGINLIDTAECYGRPPFGKTHRRLSFAPRPLAMDCRHEIRPSLQTVS